MSVSVRMCKSVIAGAAAIVRCFLPTERGRFREKLAVGDVGVTQVFDFLGYHPAEVNLRLSGNLRID